MRSLWLVFGRKEIKSSRNIVVREDSPTKKTFRVSKGNSNVVDPSNLGHAFDLFLRGGKQISKFRENKKSLDLSVRESGSRQESRSLSSNNNLFRFETNMDDVC